MLCIAILLALLFAHWRDTSEVNVLKLYLYFFNLANIDLKKVA